MNKQYKYSPEKTKNIVQSLYEKKILSYPRTDCNYNE
nr:DNA topoisomerase [Staphylococcus aureus]